MKQFTGFPARMQFTAIPNLFFSALLPQIDDITELKVALHFFELLYRKRGYPRFVTYHDLLGDKSLMASLTKAERPPEEVLRDGLNRATGHEIILHLALENNGKSEDIYFLNTESQRQLVAKIQGGELKLSGLKVSEPATVITEALPDIFTLYEQNIGLLTPMVADELRDAEKLYPADWIREAIGEAVSLNKRNWRYISRILENWASEGKSSGTYSRDSKKTDPNKYVKGKYQHLVQR